MKFQVTASKWGNYVKGDILEMHPSTGRACYEVVKLFKAKEVKETKK